MEQNEIKGGLFNAAGIEGLKLGLISAVYVLATQFLEKADSPVFIVTILAMVLWLVKFIACIWVMRQGMLKFAAANEGVERKDTLRFGILTALLSAFVFAAFSYANVAFIAADMIAEQFELAMQQMAPMLDSNSMSLVEKFMENMPVITLISNFIYCFLYGIVLSAILSSKIPATDPFADYKPQE